MPHVHVVFGAGQVGVPLATQLATSGHDVRLVNRSGKGLSLQGVARVAGDAMAPAFCIEAARGAAVVYHCMNPPYSSAVWAEAVPRILDNLIAAAGRADARLVVLDNVYALGRTGGRPMSEDTPSNPVSRKGAIRARAAETLFAAHSRGDVRAVSGRASDYYGPGSLQTMFGLPFWKRAMAGKRVQIPANPDTLHTYHFIPDVADGLARLGQADDDVCGRWWMLPCAPAVTTRELVGKFGAALGRQIRISRVDWLVSALRFAVPFFRELHEMQYQWEETFVVADGRFRERFGVTATPLDRGARETVEWARRVVAA